MNILEAIEEMRNGKLVKRTDDHWVYYITSSPFGNSLMQKIIDPNGKLGCREIACHFTYLDVASNNWEVYEIPNN